MGVKKSPDPPESFKSLTKAVTSMVPHISISTPFSLTAAAGRSWSGN